MQNEIHFVVLWNLTLHVSSFSLPVMLEIHPHRHNAAGQQWCWDDSQKSGTCLITTITMVSVTTITTSLCGLASSPIQKMVAFHTLYQNFYFMPTKQRLMSMHAVHIIRVVVKNSHWTAWVHLFTWHTSVCVDTTIPEICSNCTDAY